jgi:hypothetical protein
MQAGDVTKMIEHYFCTTDSLQKQRVMDTIGGCEGGKQPKVKLTPAQVEKYVCEWDDVDGMIGCLENVKGKGAKLNQSEFATASEINVGS